MNNRELEDLLKSAPAPERSAEYWETFAGKVVGRLRERAQPAGLAGQKSADSLGRRPASPTWIERLAALRFAPRLAAGAAACAVVCVAAGLAFHARQGQRDAGANTELVQARKYFGEIHALFPNQLQAIIFGPQGARLELADRANLPSSPPLYLKVCGPDGCQRFVTFSGQQIRIDGEVCDVLLDHQGNVLLVGRRLVWNSAHPAKASSQYQIEASLLATTS